MKKFLLVLALGLVAFTAAACRGEDTPDETTPDETPVETTPDETTPDETTPDETTPEVTADVQWGGMDTATVEPFGPMVFPFDPMYGVTVTVDGADFTHLVEYDTDDLDQYREGTYDVVYTLEIGDDTYTETRQVIVEGDEHLDKFPTGTYSFMFAETETRHELFAAMESYLLETMYGGIPVFSNSGYVMYSDRVDLPVDEWIPVMGWAATLGTLTADDSTVEMAGEVPGNPGEFTFRMRLGQNPATLHQWIYRDATSADVIGFFLDNMYYFTIDAEGESWELLPSMASDFPQPQDPTTLPSGAVISDVWEVPLREGLKWFFHDDTLTNYPALADQDDIVAQDFIDTYKLAIDQGWFRALAGGGDFMTAPQEILNARAYRDGDAAWADVGLKALDDTTLEFTFVQPIDEWTVSYWLSSWVMTPIHIGLFDLLADDDLAYGVSPETTAYHGPFYLEYYEADSTIDLIENPEFHSPDRYNITGIQYQIIASAEVAFQAFLNGDFDSIGVPAAEVRNHVEDAFFVPGATTFRIMINMLQTQYRQDQMFPDSNYTPEPILGHPDFRKAMYFAIDREQLADSIVATPQQFLYTQQYLVDPANTDLAFRDSPQGLPEVVGADLGWDTHGYAPDAATLYWESAISDMVERGYYNYGDVIEMDLLIFSGSVAQATFGGLIKLFFESTFVYNVEGEDPIRVVIRPEAKDFPGIYFDWMMTGRFDLSIGGISGSTLNAASFMDVFADDNRGGFTLNWGIDTSTPNILVEVYNPVTEQMEEQLWSFNAIQLGMVGTVTVEDGWEVLD